MLPDIYLFNPTCDFAIGNGTVSWKPNQRLQQMESDLATLPMFFAKPGDYVFVNKIPSKTFINSFKSLGFELPNFITINQALNDNNFLNLPKGSLYPWGWSPATHHLLKPLKKTCSFTFLSQPNSEWHSSLKEMYSKKAVIELLNKLLASEIHEYLLPTNYIPEVCSSISEIEKLYKKWGKLMVKAPWSSSGRGLQPVSKIPIHLSIKNRILGIIKDQGYVMVEPLLDKLLDLAFLFKVENKKIIYLGIQYFFTDSKGQYRGNYLNGLPVGTNQAKLSFLEKINEKLIPKLLETLQNNPLVNNYSGNLGIDALLYTENNQFKIHPCLEINLRFPMSLIAQRVERFVAPNKKGVYKTFIDQELSFAQFTSEMNKKHPPLYKDNKLSQGFFPLTDIENSAKFGAYLLVD